MLKEYRQNLHTHTSYCDGKDTPDEMIRIAMEKGFHSIGFSGHSYMHYSPGHSMSPEGTQAYTNEVSALKEKYAGRIAVFLGLEVDMFSEIDMSGYEYLIGSVHYLPVNGEMVGFDRSREEVARVIHTCFGGSGMAYAKEYYRQLARLPEFGSFDILGHFDLVCKHAENCRFFDEDAKEYRYAAIEAAEALAGKIPLFEVNTGAIARGYRTTPYPSLALIREMKRMGYGAVISSDCHDARYLDCAFTQAAELLRTAGYTEQFVLTEKGFVPTAL